MFRNIEELVGLAEKRQLALSDIMLEQERAITDTSREQLLEQMARSFQVMRQAAHRGTQGVVSHSGMTGGDAKRLHSRLESGRGLTDPTLLKALAYALATSEVNAAMGVVCATPTAGSSGVLPGVLLAVQERLNLADDQVVKALFAAGAIGFVVANNACVSGAQGGCQAEVGTASAMAAAAVVELAGGTPAQCAHAAAMALKNMLGLVCDPLAGLVEVPCIKRNAAGAANALAAAEMALAGIESHVPWDEVVEAMYQVGQAMPQSLRETAQGGLAATATGKKWKDMLWDRQAMGHDQG